LPIGRLSTAVLLIALTIPVSLRSQEYLSGSEVAGIATGVATSFVISERIAHFDSTAHIFWKQPGGLERSLMASIGGSYYTGKSNFLDSKVGSAYTGLGAGIALGLVDLTWAKHEETKTFFQDQFLFISGLAATKAVTAMLKGGFRRKRPNAALYPEQTETSGLNDFTYNHRSFVSGHASSAFFASAYLNIRLRSVMHSRMTSSHYRTWRWLPPGILYSWATLVGWTRIHAYKHYPSDVLAGAAVGIILAELFHSLGKDGWSESSATGDTPSMFRVSFSF
jgi:membrane-associated phospholipid phosphatase